jgi:hypothetical protein
MVSPDLIPFQTYAILMTINIGVFSILFLLSLYLVYRVFLIFKYNGDTIMFWSVFTISLSIATVISYLVITVYKLYH